MRSQIKTLACVAAAGGLFIAVLPATQAQATNTGQPHEARIDITSGDAAGTTTGWKPIGPVSAFQTGAEASDGPAFNPAAYPTGATVRLRYVAGGERGKPGSCLRLYDVTAQQAIAGTEHCINIPNDVPTLEKYLTVQTGPLRLAPGLHVYNLQEQPAVPYARWVTVARSELIINWTE